MNYHSYSEFLREEFAQRRELNSSYSLRAFARDLKMSPAALSLVLSKKKGISLAKATFVAKKLKLNDELSSWFCASVGANHSRSAVERKKFEKKLQSTTKPIKQFDELNLEYFKVISDWHHFAILELTYLKNFKSEPKWCATQLGITEQEVTSSVERLVKLGLLQIKEKRWIDTFKFLATPNDIPSHPLKKYNSQLINKSLSAIQEQSVSEREIASHVISIDATRMNEFKNKIRSFLKDFEVTAANSEEKNSVYCLSVQFFNLTKEIL
jgi:uncharacterized protein (TIGR02147 family)